MAATHHLLHLEFADEYCRSQRYLARARALVSVELHASSSSFFALLNAARRESEAAQLQVARELQDFRDAMAQVVQASASQEVILSPLSGKRRSLGGAHHRCAQLFMFPSVTAPALCSGTQALYTAVSRKRPREDERGDSTDSGTMPLCHRNGNAEDEAGEAAMPCSTGSSDAVYYEALLAQSIDAELFLQHSHVTAEGEVFLSQLQRIQEELAVASRYVEDVNAARFLEQSEFKKTHGDLCSLVAKSQEKVAALQRILKVGGDTPAANNNGGSRTKNVNPCTRRRGPSLLQSLE